MLEVNMVFKVADLYIVLYNSIVSNLTSGHGCEGIYFGENVEHTIYDVSRSYGDWKNGWSWTNNFYERKKLTNIFGWVVIQTKLGGTNSRARADGLGWKPVRTTKDFLESIKPEILVLVRKSENAQKPT